MKKIAILATVLLFSSCYGGNDTSIRDLGLNDEESLVTVTIYRVKHSDADRFITVMAKGFNQNPDSRSATFHCPCFLLSVGSGPESVVVSVVGELFTVDFPPGAPYSVTIDEQVP